MLYFEGLTTVEDIKKQYKTLAKRYHPDLNRDTDTTEIMKAINGQYFEALERADKTTSTDKATGQTHTYYYNEDHEKAAAEKVSEILGADLPPNVIIWLVGTWIWIEGTEKGDTASRDKIKAAGFYWNRKKSMWYWKSHNSRSRGNTSFEDIAERYGKERQAKPARAAAPALA